MGDAVTAAETWVWLARIRRPQGRKGEVFAEILTDYPDKFAERKTLWLVDDDLPARAESRAHFGAAPQQMELIAHWLHKGGIVLHFAGIDSITAAEGLSGKMVAIPLAERATLGEDEVYISDLIGCALVDVAGADPVTVGSVEDVDKSAGPVALLVVRGSAGEVLIPFAKGYLRNLDLTGRRLEMALPVGLVDLNAPGSGTR